jgi:hypothetical protein
LRREKKGSTGEATGIIRAISSDYYKSIPRTLV